MSYKEIDFSTATTVCDNCGNKIKCEATNNIQVCPECREEFQLDLSTKYIE